MVHATSQLWAKHIIDDIHHKAQLGRYPLRGFSTFQRVPHFDELVFLSTGLTRVPLEGYKEKCNMRTVIGSRFAKEPLVLDIPIYITGMSFGALSRNAKVGLAKGASAVGTATCTGDGGMHPDERKFSTKLIYQILPSRYGFNPEHMIGSQALEILVGQGAKPGSGGLLMGKKVSAVIGRQRDLPEGIDQRSPTRHPDWFGPDDLAIKIEQLREATDWRIPIHIKLAACRVRDDVKIAAKIGADAIVIDGMQGGTGAAPEVMLDHTAIPTMASITQAREALEEIGLYGKVSLIISGGIRNGADAAKALALGADAVAIGQAAMIALNCNRHLPGVTDYPAEVGVEAGYCRHCDTGKCPVGITTQDPVLEARLDPEAAGERVANFLNAMTMEMGLVARSTGKSDVHSLEPEDLAALTMEASLMTKVPLAGTDYRPWEIETKRQSGTGKKLRAEK